MARVIGIDLGTTNSCVAVMEEGQPVVIANAEGDRTTPSVVGISAQGERLVGLTARRQMVTNPEHTIFSSKRFMGRRMSDPEVQRAQDLMPYPVTAGPDGELRLGLRGRDYAPPEIAAMILQKLKTDAEHYLGTPVTQAVITVPAYFNDGQRQATQDAGKIAGLEVLRIINEPTASALAYGLAKSADQRIAVYDLGGGTFDISVLELGGGVFEVRATNGDAHLGGDDFDQRIVDWLLDGFTAEHGIDLRQDSMALQRVKEAAEKAKRELSSLVQTEVNLPFITADASGPRHLRLVLSRAKLEQLIADLIESTVEPARQALADAGVKPGEVDEVLLVGGQTRMPAVRQMVTRVLGKQPKSGVNPDEVVAMGAAVQAGVLAGDVPDVLLLDVTPLSLGIETRGGVFTPLIERNTTIPTSQSRAFSTAADGQRTVEIKVLQGERSLAADNYLLGRFELTDLPEAPRGVPQIDVTFDIDANGIAQVGAKDRASGSQQQITVSGGSRLTEEELAQLLVEAEQHGQADRSAREEIEARNAAEKLAHRTERAVGTLGKRLTAKERQALEAEVLALRSALTGTDRTLVETQTEALRAALERTGGRLYEDEDEPPEAAAPKDIPREPGKSAAADGRPPTPKKPPKGEQ